MEREVTMQSVMTSPGNPGESMESIYRDQLCLMMFDQLRLAMNGLIVFSSAWGKRRPSVLFDDGSQVLL